MHPNIPLSQDPTPKQIPLISLSLTGNSPQSNYIPIISKPLKDNPSNELCHLRSFDPSAFFSNASHRIKQSAYEMKLPHLDFKPISTSQSVSSSKTFSIQNFPTSILFKPDLISMFFKKFGEQYQVQITPEAATAILNSIVKQFFEILLRSAQCSRQRSAVYYPPFTNREITSSPQIKQTLLNFELFSSNQCRHRAFNNDNIDEFDPYEPYFYKTFDANQVKALSQENSIEKAEYYQYSFKIIQNLKYRGMMFKQIANEIDKTYADQLDQLYANYLKTDKMQQQPGTKQTQFNLKANEFFGGAENEENNKKNRMITPKDILEGFERMPPLYQTYLPLWRLSHLSQVDDD